MCAVEGDGAGQGSDSNAGIYIYPRQVLQGGVRGCGSWRRPGRLVVAGWWCFSDRRGVVGDGGRFLSLPFPFASYFLSDFQGWRGEVLRPITLPPRRGDGDGDGVAMHTQNHIHLFAPLCRTVYIGSSDAKVVIGYETLTPDRRAADVTYYY